MPGTREAAPNYPRTDGVVIVWAAASPGSPPAGPFPDLYRFDPRIGETQKVFANPNRDSRLLPIGIGGGHFTFTEENLRLYGPSGWRLWYLASPGAPAIQLDRSDPPGGVEGPLPFAAIDASHVVWTAFHGPAARPRAELRMIELATLRLRTLLSADAKRIEYWFPSLDGDRLAFASVEYTPTRSADVRHVYLAHLSSSQLTPRVLDATGDAANPAIHGDYVVWKRSINELNWGSLVLYRLSTGVATPLRLGPDPANLDWPAVGSRYVAAQSLNFGSVDLYDIKTGLSVNLEHWPSGQEGGFDRHLAGDLFVYVQGVVGGRSELRWLRLPP